MSGFAYRNGTLHAEDVSLADLAARFGTPAYVYAGGAMRARFREWRDAFVGMPVLFCYAVKANANLAVLRLFAQEGAGADVVSGGELERALAAGVPPSRVVFSGLGKTREELLRALEVGIAQINVESVPELVALSELAAQSRHEAPVAIRVNPDIAADTHDKISTGRKGDKFGIAHGEAHAAYALAASLPGIRPVGLHVHIGSQIGSLATFGAAYRLAAAMAGELLGAGVALRRLDLGGGFGARYRKDDPPFDIAGFAAMVRRVTGGLGLDLVFEPGRAFVAEAGVLLARVLYVKQSGSRRVAILDAGMNVLIRVAMYDAHHEILPVALPPEGAAWTEADVVGPICESSDVFARGRLLPPLAAGDLVVLTSAGAYGAVMASDYNARPGACEILVEDARAALVKPRRLPAAQLADEVLPEWLQGVPRPAAGG